MALLGLAGCGANFHGLRLHAVQRQTPDVSIPDNVRAARPGWQGVFVELRGDRSLRAHAARHSITFGLRASLCDNADTELAILERWNQLSVTRPWDVAGELDQHLVHADTPTPYRYWLGLDTITVASVGRNSTPTPMFVFVNHDLRTGMRGVCLHARGFGWLRGEWFTNVVYIPAETLREVANQPPPDQPSAPTSPRR